MKKYFWFTSWNFYTYWSFAQNVENPWYRPQNYRRHEASLFAKFIGIYWSKMLKFASTLKILSIMNISSTMKFTIFKKLNLLPGDKEFGKKNQQEWIDEILHSGWSLSLALDDLCNSPGHNATYNTVTALDVDTNFSISWLFHLKVRVTLYIKIKNF